MCIFGLVLSLRTVETTWGVLAKFLGWWPQDVNFFLKAMTNSFRLLFSHFVKCTRQPCILLFSAMRFCFSFRKPFWCLTIRGENKNLQLYTSSHFKQIVGWTEHVRNIKVHSSKSTIMGHNSHLSCTSGPPCKLYFCARCPSFMEPWGHFSKIHISLSRNLGALSEPNNVSALWTFRASFAFLHNPHVRALWYPHTK